MAQEGKRVKALDSRPHLDPLLQFYWDGFSVLDRGRESGMHGPCGISFLSIDAFASRYGVDGIEFFDRFLRLIMAMDDAYFSHIAQLQKTNDHGKGSSAV